MIAKTTQPPPPGGHTPPPPPSGQPPPLPGGITPGTIPPPGGHKPVFNDFGCGTNKMEHPHEEAHETIPHSWKWQADIYYKGKFECSGSLISPNLVVTTAKCARSSLGSSLDPQDLVIILGDHSR